jgi:putative ABC transport system permease protein
MSARVLLVRLTGDEPERMIEPLRRAMQSAAPNLPFADVRVMRSLLDRQVRPWKLGATMFGVFGALALVLTALGLYSVIAFAVVQRTHEMGVRIALGARPGEIRSLVVTQGVAIAVIGVALGAAFALLAGSVVEPLLFHESPYDPLVFAVVGVVLVGVSALASIVPAARASHVDPVVAMRAD